MLRLNKFLFLIICLSYFGSCAYAPMAGPKTGKALELGKKELSVQFNPQPSLMFAYGVLKKLDAGVILEQSEYTIVGLFIKYQFFLRADDFAAAFFSGVSLGNDLLGGSKSFFLGPVVSRRVTKNLDFYFVTRYVHSFWTRRESGDMLLDDFVVEVVSPKATIRYMQYDLGFNYWISPFFSINAEGKIQYYFGNNTTQKSETLFGVGFNFKL